MKQVAAAILYHPQGKVLLQHRDDKPDIPHPNKWGLFGGAIEVGETPEGAMLRELQEELSFTPQRYHYFVQIRKQEVCYHFFLAHIDAALDSLVLDEGQGFGYFSVEEALATLDLADSSQLLLDVLQLYQRYRQSYGLNTMLDLR